LDNPYVLRLNLIRGELVKIDQDAIERTSPDFQFGDELKDQIATTLGIAASNRLQV